MKKSLYISPDIKFREIRNITIFCLSKFNGNGNEQFTEDEEGNDYDD